MAGEHRRPQIRTARVRPALHAFRRDVGGGACPAHRDGALQVGAVRRRAGGMHCDLESPVRAQRLQACHRAYFNALGGCAAAQPGGAYRCNLFLDQERVLAQIMDEGLNLIEHLCCEIRVKVP